jgi:CRP-like cAMP-binding protein
MTASLEMTSLMPDAEAPLPEAFRAALLHGATQLPVRRGKVVIKQGSVSDDVFYIVEGVFRVMQFAPNNRDTILREIGPGSIFGELAAIDAQPRSVSVIARESGSLAVLSAAQFLDFLRNVPGAGLWMAQQLAARVRHLSERAFELATLPVSYRLQGALLRLGLEAGIAGDQSLIVRLPTHADLAARIGTHREAVTRELGLLASEGVIAQSGRELRILSVSKLRTRFPEPRG